MKSFSITRKLMSVLLLFISTISHAQNNEEVYLIKPYDPSVSDATRIRFSPSLSDTFPVRPQMNYLIQAPLYETHFTPDSIKAAKFNGEPLSKLYRFLLKGGFGNYATPYVDILYNNLRSRQTSVSFRYKHLSSGGEIPSYAYPGFSNNLANLSVMQYMTNSTLNVVGTYKRDVVHFYGFKPSDAISVSDDDLKQKFSLTDIKLQYKSNYVDSLHLNHELALGFYNLGDNFGISENFFHLGGSIDKNVKISNITHRQTIGIKADLSFYDQSNSQSLSNLKLSPFISTNFNTLGFLLGLDVNIASENNHTTLYCFPQLEVQVNFIENVLRLYAGIGGELKPATYKTLSDENPFINPGISINYIEDKFNFYGGIKTSFSKNLNLGLSIKGSNLYNQPFFTTYDPIKYPFYQKQTEATSLGNTFILVYDHLKSLSIKAELAYTAGEKWNVILYTSYNKLSTESIQKPWYQPTFNLGTTLYYSMSDKFIIRAAIQARTGVSALTYDGNHSELIQNIDGFTDLSLGIEYRYNKLISAFLNLNNLTSQRYSLYYNYPSYKLNFMLGVSFAF